ncbi:MAG: MgtC/SapB family protein [Oxalobacter sp.]
MIDTLFGLEGVQVAASTEIPYLLVIVKLACAVIAGGFIGFERSFHGRPAGVRTYCLVCLASVAVVQVNLHGAIWLTGAPPDVYRADGTRIMQVLVTGIAFLGAGVIFREGFTIRGLTTAAAIWATGIIGILFGVGLFYSGALATVLLILILSCFQKIKGIIPAKRYAHFNVTFAREGTVTRERFFALLAAHQLETSGNISHHLVNGGEDYEVDLTIRSHMPEAFSRLSKTLREQAEFKTYSIRFIRN